MPNEVTNNSPWIRELDAKREVRALNTDLKTDIAVVGAGIAGISTAFFLLKHTDKKITLIEGGKLAHGATGHNAGQIVRNFEKPFKEIVTEFGLEMACQGYADVDSGWELIDLMYTEAGLDIQMSRFTGPTGYSTKKHILGRLEGDYLRRKGGLRTDAVWIAEDADFLDEIPQEHTHLFSLVPREEIALKLETFDTSYVGVSFRQKGVINSALFCQEVAKYLIEKYPERFALYEHTRIKKVVLKETGAILDAIKHTVECDKVVLCTNGFENFDIIAPSGLSIDTRFHHNIHGVVGFMSGYLEKPVGVPAALQYFQQGDVKLTDTPGEGYFYVTRRPYEYEKDAKHSLVSIGGPDFALEDRAIYDRNLEFSEKAKKQIADFVRRTYDKSHDLEYAFMWHGVMGYTKNLLRMIGPDPEHSHLFYNLGCNGIGILPSVFGGDKVARQIKGETFAPSIFDIPKRV